MEKSELYTLLKTEQTPFYVFDTDVLAERLQKVKTAFGGRAQVCFAMKANPMLTGPAAELADHLEVCSPGEFSICEKLGVDPSKIVYSGVYKDPDSTRHAFEKLAGSGVMTIESLHQLELIDEIARETGKTMDVIIRITSGNQFGMDKEAALDLIERRLTYEKLHFLGFQMYTGTQKRKVRTIEKELAKLDELVIAAGNYGFETQILEYGPGLPVNHFTDDDFEEEQMLEAFAEALKTMAYQGALTIEMGRFLVSGCGSYVTAIGDVKRNKDRGYLITDGGNHQLKYYGQSLGMKLPCFEHIRKNETDAEKEKWDICGALCTVHDVIARDAELKGPAAGDLLVFKNAGDYSATEGSALFLSRDIPAVYGSSKKDGVKLLRKRYSAAEINCI